MAHNLKAFKCRNTLHPIDFEPFNLFSQQVDAELARKGFVKIVRSAGI